MRYAQKRTIAGLGFLVLASIFLGSLVTEVSAQHEGEIRKASLISGKALFAASCASCHGVDAKGNTELAQTLIKRPADLTSITKKNDGTFPFLRILDVIDGRNDLVVHGPRGMPVWGRLFYEEEYPFQASGRIFDLTIYIESVQE